MANKLVVNKNTFKDLVDSGIIKEIDGVYYNAVGDEVVCNDGRKPKEKAVSISKQKASN